MKNVLYFDLSTFRSMCAVPHMADFGSSLISCYPGTLLRYCQSDFEMVPVASIIIIIILIYFYYLYTGCLQLYSETNRVSRVYNVGTILWLQYMVHVMLFPMINVVYLTLILSSVCAQSPVWLFSVLC